MEAECGQRFGHTGQRAALRGHRGHGPTGNSAVEEPHSRRGRKLDAETQTDSKKKKHSSGETAV